MLFCTVALLLLFGSLGCGVPDEEEAVEEEPTVEEEERVDEEPTVEEEERNDEEKEEPALDVDNWRNPTEISEIVDNFAEMEWTWSRLENGSVTDSTTINYKYEGSETVDGVDTEVLSFSIDAEGFKAWVDKDGNVIQAEVEGEIIPGQFVDQAMEGALSAMFSPFWTFEELGIHDALVETTPGFEWSVISTEEKQIGNMDVEVTHLEVDVKPPLTPEGEEGTVTWSVGDFGQFQMLIEWDWIETAGEEEMSIQYSLDKAVAR